MTKEREYQFHKYYMALAYETSKLSYAQRNQVGSVLVKNNSIIAQGFNGTPTGMDNICEIENEDGTLSTKKEVIHSELNCITKCAKAGISTEGATLYVTLGCCINCALLLIQSGIKKVIYDNEYRDSSGIDLLKQIGIEVYSMEELK